MKGSFFLILLGFLACARDFSIPKTLYPTPAVRSQDKELIAAAKPYLKLSPETYQSLVPKESPAPVLTETDSYSSSYHHLSCPFCGNAGSWFRYDLIQDPHHIYCRETGKDLMSFPCDGIDSFTDYSGKQYQRRYHITSHVKGFKKKGPIKAYPENYFAQARIQALLGTWKGGALNALAQAYYATGDLRYASRVIAILMGFAQALPAYPWMGHSSTVPQPREELLAKARLHDSGYHGWLGPARIAAAETNFRTPMEAVYFNNLAKAYMMVEDATCWQGRKDFVRRNLFQEGSLLFRAYGAKQCMGNGIGMYAPVLNSLGVLLQDDYLYDGFLNILQDFLYNENYYDGSSVEGSPAYASMVGGMWHLFKEAGLMDNPQYLKRHPFLRHAGQTIQNIQLCRGGHPPYGDDHPSQYWICKPIPQTTVPGEELGGFGISVLRAGAADRRLELFFHHDRAAGHSHDDMLSIQLFYRGIPLLEHYGDTRNTVDLTDKVPHAACYRKLDYPAPMVTQDSRPRGFSLQDMTTGLTKNTLIIDDYWAENSWYAAYRGGQGCRRQAPYGNLIARTGRCPEKPFQFVEAEGVNMNAKDYQGIRLYKRALMAVTRPDGTPYAVDFFAVSGGHRHLLLFHSRGKELHSTLPLGKDYPHLEDLPDETGVVSSFTLPAGSILFPGKVLNQVNYGGAVRDSWKHAWLFDYAAWASKTLPPAKDLLVQPHVFSIHGFLRGNAKAIRATGHYPLTIKESFDGAIAKRRFQFENAIRYAGLRAAHREGLSNCYVQCYSAYAQQEKPLFASVTAIDCDDSRNPYKRAVELTFDDGSKDIVLWQPRSERSSWDGDLFSTDARAALIRLNHRGKVKYVSLAGGTMLTWRGRTLIATGQGTLTGTLKRLEGDISGQPDRSVLVVEPTSGVVWPQGDALRGQTIIVSFNQGRRNEAYTVKSIDISGQELRISLERAPFFIDHRGEIKQLAGDPALYDSNMFIGTETIKGGATTDYLVGSRIVIPEIGKSFTLKRLSDRRNYCYIWELAEPVDLSKLGVRPGMHFHVQPDIRDAQVHLMTSLEKEL